MPFLSIIAGIGLEQGRLWFTHSSSYFVMSQEQQPQKTGHVPWMLSNSASAMLTGSGVGVATENSG